jgi:hypothetical protein
MTSEQRAELVGCHPDNAEDAPQGTLGHVPAGMYRDRDRTPIWVLHHVVAAGDPRETESGALQRLDYLCSRDGRDGTRHKPRSYQKSSDVECHSQLIGWLNYIEKSFERVAQVGDRVFLCRPLANRADAGAEDAGGTPDAVLILLDGVGHVNDTSHRADYVTSRHAPARSGTCLACADVRRRVLRCAGVCRHTRHRKGRLGTS